ncbi:AIR synthase family protein [Fuchsiella alkaliacetigena]|uniref:AIR synthase family protein n=1 Tax=Fuchsiella alkaliacetigena TaxID=957042 RepID=UPI00200B5C7F|nr:AIR synthase family protein [Fuchsiella alkaliacetigena]MCK8824110.1 AIR synthase family protein [Fuchsiella alkaliacetigena]
MDLGKVNTNHLKNLILNRISANHEDVLVRPKIGEDSAVIDFGEFVAVISSDPITGVQEGMGSLAVNVACNDIAANGAEPIGIQEILLVPPGTAEEEVAAIVEDIDKAAQELGIDILGGHTEVTEVVNQPLVCCTAIGKTTKDKFVTSSGAKIGDDIIVTKWTGLEGTVILAVDFEKELLAAGVEPELLAEAKALAEQLSVLPEGLIGAELGVNAMHDTTEGGLYGSLYELAEAAEIGFRIDKELLPLHKATQAISEALEIDPCSLIGSGMMIITADDGQQVVKELQENEIKATLIGEIIEGQRIIETQEGKVELNKAPQDELWRLLEEK